MKHLIETIGYISKTETVRSIDHNIIPNTLVIENVEPFPGYHGSNLPNDQPPLSIFLVTQKRYVFEDISRISTKVRKQLNENFNSVYGYLKIYNENYHSIRIMGLNSFEKIAAIQKEYEKEGIKFSNKKSINDCAIIKIQKTFILEEIEDGIYKDHDESDMTYLQIHRKISWNEFQKTTHHIKNNIEYSNFDAALGYIFRHSGIVDLIRIYSRNITHLQLKKLKNIYNEELKK